MKDGLYAKFITSKGDIIAELTYTLTPGTVGNFVSLAEGNLKNDFKKNGEPYYDGIKFHRVIPNSMIQGGCPQSTGTGGPGYQFDDEFVDDFRHSLMLKHLGQTAEEGDMFSIRLKPGVFSGIAKVITARTESVCGVDS